MDKNSIKKILEGKNSRIRVEDVENSIAFLKEFGYAAKKILGVGAFGAVIEAKHIVSNETDAIKLIYTPDQHSINDCIQEAIFMAQMNSPHIVKFIDNFYDPDNSIFYIVFQFCSNGDLQNYIKNNPNLSQRTIIKLFKGILNGIIDIQKQKILHGDIKPQNVVINAESNSLLTDFGLSKQLVADQSQISMKGITLAYAPKEQEEGGKLVPQSDYFSAGLILFFMCRPMTTDLEMIVMKYGNFPQNLEQSKNYNLIQVALKMMKVLPKERMNPNEALINLEQIESQIIEQEQQQKIVKSVFPSSFLSTEIKIFDNGLYEGTVLEDKMHGEGTFHYFNGNRYEGKYKNDQENGKGKLFLADGRRLECEFKNGEANGEGKLFLPDGGLLQCEYKNGRANGKGDFQERVYFNFTLSQGKCYYDNGNFLECEYINGEATGQGIYQYVDGDRLECEYKYSRPNGKGKLFKSNGDILECEYKNGQANGQGKYYYPDGDRLECEFRNGSANGFGKLFFASGKRLECEYKDGKKNGKGKLFLPEGRIFETEYKNGIPDGEGILYDAESKIIQAGFWIDGEYYV